MISKKLLIFEILQDFFKILSRFCGILEDLNDFRDFQRSVERVVENSHHVLSEILRDFSEFPTFFGFSFRFLGLCESEIFKNARDFWDFLKIFGIPYKRVHDLPVAQRIGSQAEKL